MDVTPGPQLFHAMSKLVDALVGEAPSTLLVGTAANQIRAKRDMAFEVLHKIVAVSMREGVNRAILESKKRNAGILDVPQDREDAGARAQAKDDAQAGATVVDIKGKPLH